MHEHIDRLKLSGELPDGAEYMFDQLNTGAENAGPSTRVMKTRRRKVVTLKYGRFQVREVVRQTRDENREARRVPNTALARLVPSGCQYGFDMIAHVGLESFLFGHRLEVIQNNLRESSPSIDVPTSSLDELRRRFLFYLGQVHQAAAPALRDALNQSAGLTWLIDGSVEPGTPVFFGIQDASTAILLGCRKIPSESADAIAPCLTETASDFGEPRHIFHDLSPAMGLACETAFDNVPHYVCHFHFLRDVGEGLFTKPHNALSSRLRSLKLQVVMREQRKTQTEWLRAHNGEPEAALKLQQLLRGEPITAGWNETLGKEVLLALHFWMLDYAADGSRQGFPFDPYFLYFHRRLIRGHNALVKLLSRECVAAHVPKPLFNLRDRLERYCTDPQIIAATSHYEMAFSEFARLRTTLRLEAAGDNPMRHEYDLDADLWHQVHENIDSLGKEYRERIASSSDDLERGIYTIILTHIDKYSSQLAPPAGSRDTVRTTNQLESHWGESKRTCRQTQGRRKLTRTFNSLPSELMLIPNLRNPQYLKIVLDGNLDQLPTKFANTNMKGSSYASWRQTATSLNLGRLPSRILRQSDFVESVIEIYDDQCNTKNRQAA